MDHASGVVSVGPAVDCVSEVAIPRVKHVGWNQILQLVVSCEVPVLRNNAG